MKCFKIPSDCEFSFPSLFVFLAVMEYGEGEGSVKVSEFVKMVEGSVSMVEGI